ncbi:YfhO family protein [Furfurilactobacillus curtus]|uniref:Membrane protein n=1 Tax=Furfurilactobacillus curtus TaxID=1746200 RepID=A0ABQ5JMT3_9LACO
MQIHLNLKDHWPLYLSFLIPALFMTSYFASRGMAPFGNSSLLTVDMGQQYIDFFAFFRNTLLHQPGNFFYSFGKALGGETTSLWAYYLMSPFNLCLLPFYKGGLSSGVLLITVLKYGCAGLSLAWVLDRLNLQHSWRLPTLATAYSMCGWTIANQLNLMWLDALILLPLVVFGLEQLVVNQRYLPYIGWLAAIFIINYYMAYMISLFTLLYLIFSIIWHRLNRRQVFRATLRYLSSSILAVGLASFILIPTYLALQLSKTSYTLAPIKWKFDYFPPKMLGKFFPGSFNFAQMPKGQPNLFVGAVVIILVIAFFLESSVKWPVKLAAGLITAILGLSVCYTPLNLLWHAGQFPIWYPYRFSFIVCFWLVWLSAIAWPKQIALKWRTIIVTLLLLIAVTTYCYVNLRQVNFLTVGQLLTGFIIMLIALICFTPWPGHYLWLRPFILILTIADLGTNAVLSLNKISYVPQRQFAVYTDTLDTASQTTKKTDAGFYRIGSTFQRTKDDPLQGDYAGGSHFGSTLERKTIGFYDLTGNPDGDGFVTYANGTQFMDALLNFKYFWSVNETPLPGHKSTADDLPALTMKPDLHRYTAITQLPQTTTYRNPNALGIGFMAAGTTQKLKDIMRDPMTNQNQLWDALLGQQPTSQLFQAVNFDQVSFHNTNSLTNITGSTLTKRNLKRPATMTLTFTPPTDDAYYLSLGANLQKENVRITLNDRPLAQFDTFRNTVLVNLANRQKGQPQTITFHLKKPALWLQNVTLYHLPQRSFAAGISKLQQHPLTVTSWGTTHVSGTVTATAQQPILMTSIPAQPGWRIMVDGHSIRPFTVADEFMAIKLTPGHHKIQFRYQTPGLWLGIGLSVASLLVVEFVPRFQRWQKKYHHVTG